MDEALELFKGKMGCMDPGAYPTQIFYKIFYKTDKCLFDIIFFI